MTNSEKWLKVRGYGKTFESYKNLIQRDYILKEKIREYAKSIVDDDTYKMNWRYDVDGTNIRRELEELIDNDN